MYFNLEKKVILLTGGSLGIGAQVIEFLLKENVKHVAILDVAEDKGIALQNELNGKYGKNKVKFIKCDVTNDGELFSAFDTVNKEQEHIDVVINNAGIMNDAKDKYKKEIDINITALTTSTLKALELMRVDDGGKGGVVLNISSTAALQVSGILPIYCATKSYVLQFSNNLGLPEYYARTGVRVIAICFGLTATSLIFEENIGCFDKVMKDNVSEILAQYQAQKPESAAKCVIEVLKSGESGSTWLSNSDKPAQDITDVVKKSYDVFSELLK